ncbi:MAG: hypothetical protein K0Q73_5639 [Paenibacillus sp.]|jgi:hypothetical protein|nr:hypothetical protein [Paenibacillus sp.]
MNIHDKRRKDDTVKSLAKAKEKAENHRLYLTVKASDPEEIATANIVLEHINIALEHLGALLPADT